MDSGICYFANLKIFHGSWNNCKINKQFVLSQPFEKKKLSVTIACVSVKILILVEAKEIILK